MYDDINLFQNHREIQEKLRLECFDRVLLYAEIVMSNDVSDSNLTLY